MIYVKYALTMLYLLLTNLPKICVIVGFQGLASDR